VRKRSVEQRLQFVAAGADDRPAQDQRQIGKPAAVASGRSVERGKTFAIERLQTLYRAVEFIGRALGTFDAQPPGTRLRRKEQRTDLVAGRDRVALRESRCRGIGPREQPVS
jgi:hypothetical protein